MEWSWRSYREQRSRRGRVFREKDRPYVQSTGGLTSFSRKDNGEFGAPLNYAGERESPTSLATQQQQLMACVAVIRVTVHFVDTVAISACIGLAVINVPGHSSPVTTSNQNVDGSCPEL